MHTPIWTHKLNSVIIAVSLQLWKEPDILFCLNFYQHLNSQLIPNYFVLMTDSDEGNGKTQRTPHQSDCICKGTGKIHSSDAKQICGTVIVGGFQFWCPMLNNASRGLKMFLLVVKYFCWRMAPCTIQPLQAMLEIQLPHTEGEIVTPSSLSLGLRNMSHSSPQIQKQLPRLIL